MMILAALLLAALGVGNPNVTVSVNAEGDLLVIGDAGNNNLVIDDEAGYRRIRVGNGDSLNGVPGPTELPIAPVRGRLIVSLGDGDDTLWMSLRFREQVIYLGDGNDFLDIARSSVRTTVYAGAGNDSVHVEDAFHDRLDVFLGAGDDRCEIAFSFAEAFSIHAGPGADTVTLRASEFYGRARAIGGSGVDIYRDSGSMFPAGPPKVIGFEAGS